MRRTLLALTALGCLAVAGAMAAPATAAPVMMASTDGPQARPAVQTVQYWHHRHFWHRRAWHHRRWCYYHPGAC